MGFHFFLVYLRRKFLRSSYLLVFVFLLSVFFGLGTIDFSDHRLHVSFLDVGQGDAILIRSPEGKIVLVDGGPGTKIASAIGKKMFFIKPEMEMIILTHPHADHVSGLVYILENYKVKNIVYEREDYQTDVFQKFSAAVAEEQKEGAKVYSPAAGDVFRLGGTTIEILWPPKESNRRVLGLSTPKNPNDRSVVARLSYGSFDLFLPGDQETDEAQVMLSNTAQLDPVEVLKVAHHGSINGLYETILDQLAPTLAVISVGKDNAYGHPHRQTLDLLGKAGVKTWRTDLDGTIEVVSDGQKWSVKKDKR